MADPAHLHLSPEPQALIGALSADLVEIVVPRHDLVEAESAAQMLPLAG